jgi:hypothetical protein
MRTTIDMPDALFRKTKAVAALRGSSMKELIIHAVEREVTGRAGTEPKRHRVKLPLIQSPSGRKVDLTDFDFDDLLG